jgi:hypothetical protein
MKHLSKEQLIEHYYGEDGADVKHHLEICRECADAYAALGRDLGALKAPEAPDRASLYGEQVWGSISNSLPAYRARGGSWQRAGLWRKIGYAAACVLLIAGAFLTGGRWERKQSPITATGDDAQIKQPVVLVVLGDHLDRSERLLIELKHADASSAAAVFPLSEEARDLLPANRRCRQSAMQIDDPSLASVLDDLDRVLAELANEPGGLSASAITRLQTEMNTDGLLFEIRVLRTRVPDKNRSGIVQSREEHYEN